MRDHPVDVARRSCRWPRAPPSAAAEMFFTACVNTGLPCILTKWRLASTVLAVVGSAEPPPGMLRKGMPAPSAKRCVDRMPRSSPVVRHQQRRAGAVAEEHAGVAIGPVDHARQDLDADHEHALELPALDERVGDRHAVDEAGARRRDVERRALPGDAELLLHRHRDRRHRHVGRDGRHDDAVDLLRIDLRRLAGALARLRRQVRRRAPLLEDAPLADAGALGDPLVRRRHHLRQIVVGQHLVRRRASRPCDSCS